MVQQPTAQKRELPAGRRGRPSHAVVHQRLADLVGELKQRFGGLPSPVEAEGIWTQIWYSEAHNSTAIEGNTLVLRQVERLLGVVALRAAAERGRLRAVRGDDGRWRSSKQWVDDYRVSRHASLRGRRRPTGEA
jgi:hypothetical protein